MEQAFGFRKTHDVAIGPGESNERTRVVAPAGSERTRVQGGGLLSERGVWFPLYAALSASRATKPIKD